jgi:hypothetical protein
MAACRFSKQSIVSAWYTFAKETYSYEFAECEEDILARRFHSNISQRHAWLLPWPPALSEPCRVRSVVGRISGKHR